MNWGFCYGNRDWWWLLPGLRWCEKEAPPWWVAAVGGGGYGWWSMCSRRKREKPEREMNGERPVAELYAEKRRCCGSPEVVTRGSKAEVAGGDAGEAAGVKFRWAREECATMYMCVYRRRDVREIDREKLQPKEKDFRRDSRVDFFRRIGFPAGRIETEIVSFSSIIILIAF